MFAFLSRPEIEGESKLLIDEDKLKEDQKWDGLKAMISNTENLTPEQLISHYAGLWQVEETFRIGKGDVKMRPIYHWTDKKIRAHIAICLMALACMRFTEFEVTAPI